MNRIRIIRIEPAASRRGTQAGGVQVIYQQNHPDEERFLREFLAEQRNYKTEAATPSPDPPFMCLYVYQDGHPVSPDDIRSLLAASDHFSIQTSRS